MNCAACIWHGPGHQSRTRCSLTGRHKVHYAVYGSFDLEAYWTGREAFSGFFDEPPKHPKRKRKKAVA